MKYKLLAFDLDGTLTNSKKEISERTKAAIESARNAGCVIALASGRPVYGIMPLAKELNLDVHGGYILAYNGGCIIDCKTMEIIYDIKLPLDYNKKICDFALEHDYAILSYEGDSVITNKKDNEYVQIEAQINHLPVKEVNNINTYIDFEVNKFLITEDPETVAKEIPAVQSLFPDLNVFSSAPFFMEIVPTGIDKSDSLDALLKKLNLSVSELATFGDGGNDLGMIKHAGMGVAMANANEDCKAAANYITSSNDEDGCAIAIEKMLAGEL